MNILVVGGYKTSDFLLKSLSEKNHKITFIHYDYSYCRNISRKYNIPVICGDGSKSYILEDASINKSDIVIAITNKDSDNLVICQLAKKVYGVKKAFAIVSDPKNVEVFKKLGVDIAISSTYIVSGMIEQIATIDEINSCIPINDGTVSIMEIIVKENYPICRKFIRDIEFSDRAIIGCIIRGSNTIIPKGDTKILLEDKLIILSPPEAQKNVIRSIIGGE